MTRPPIVEQPLRLFLQRVDAVLHRETGFDRSHFVAPDWRRLFEARDNISDRTILDYQAKADPACADLLALKVPA